MIHAKRYLLALLVLSLVSLSLKAGTYYSQSSSDPGTRGNWNSVRDGSGSTPSNFTSGDIFVIQRGHTMSPAATWTVSGTGAKITLESGGVLTAADANITTPSLTIASGASVSVSANRTLTVSNGESGADFDISGTLTNAGTITLGSGAAATVRSGGSYDHARDGGTVLTATWESGSTCTISGITGTDPTGLTQSFHHFTWNCTGQNSKRSLNAGLTTVNGNLTFSSTNSQTLTLNNGNSDLTLTVGGNLVLSGATVDMSGKNGAGYITLSGNFDMSAGTLTEAGGGAARITLAGGTTQTFTKTGGTISNSVDVTVNSGTTLDMGTSVLDGNGTFTLSSGATILIGNTGGIANSGATGNVQCNTRSFSTGANYTYNGGATQVFGTALPTTVNNLTVNNGNSSMPLNASLIVSGTLTLTSGTISVGATTLTLNGTFSGSATNSLKANGTSSNLTIGGSGSFGTFYVDQTTPGTTNKFFNVTVNRSGQTVTMGNNLQVGGTLTLTAGMLAIGANTLTLDGGFSGSATAALKADGSSSSLAIGGSGTIGNIFFDQTTSGTTNRLLNLTVNRSGQTITLGNALQVTGEVTPTAGTLASGGNLTIISNASGTGRIAAIGGSADVTGSVTMQRYIPAVTRRYRMLSATSSSFTASDLIDDIFVTGPGGVSNGFDASSTNSSMVYTYQESTTGGRGWKAISNISTSVNPGVGMYIFIRGDRTLPSPAWYTQNNGAYPTTGGFPAQNATTIDFTGTINKGSVAPTITYTNTGVPTSDGWNLVGNPYPSPIDWTAVSKTNLSSFYYVYDPSSGSYVANNGSNMIAAGQAFFVQATAGSPTISFSESCKSATTPTNYFKGSAQVISVKMMKDSLNSDIAWMEFKEGGSKEYGMREDALKMSNASLNVGWLVDSTTQLQYSTVPKLTQPADSFRLYANGPVGTYTLQFSGIQLIANAYTVYLKDAFTNALVNLRTNPVYTFSITTSPSSLGNNRFTILFVNPSSLPVQLVSFNATLSGNGSDVNLNWETVSEHNNDYFAVERATNSDMIFTELVRVKGAGTSTSNNVYTQNDINAFSGPAKTYYYRLKQVDKDGSFTYTAAVAVMSQAKLDDETSVTVYPNPAISYFDIVSSKPYAAYSITDVSGRSIVKQNVSAYPNSPLTVSIENLTTGIYLVSLNAANGDVIKTVKLLKQSSRGKGNPPPLPNTMR